MPDTKISALSAVTTPTGVSEFGVNESGTSKKMTLSQIAAFGVDVPTIASVGVEFSGTGVPTATLPGVHATNDILLLILQSSNENITDIAGYTRLGPQNGIGLTVTAGSTRAGLWWKRDGGSEVAPTIPDTGDHTYGVMIAIRGCPTTGNPFHFGGNNFKVTASTAGTSPKSVAPCDQVLVMDVWVGSADNAAGMAGGTLANTDLTSVTEQFDDGTTDGTGGGIYVSTGIKASHGSVKATTVVWTNSSSDLCTRIHWLPADTASKPAAGFPPEIFTFIGSSIDVDDSWPIPPFARNVFVQVCDGGQGGSGGQSVATAAGGGGGGGGGYDEAWYRADDLTSPVNVHPGKGGIVGVALNAAGSAASLSEFDKGNRGPLTSTSRVLGVVATAAASADGGNGGSGAGRGVTTPAVATTRVALEAATAGAGLGAVGGRGGSGTTANTGGSPAEWGGGGGESGADTDAGLTSVNNGYSLRGGGGGSGGKTAATISGSGAGGGAIGVIATQGQSGTDSTLLPYGGSGGVGGGSAVVTGGTGGFPGGGGGGGGGIAGGFGGRGGHGCIVVTAYS